MNSQMREIKPLGEDRYEVTVVDEKGEVQLVICRVFSHKGVTGVRMDPDLVMSNSPSRIDSREITAAIIDYHRRRHQNSPSKGSKGNP